MEDQAYSKHAIPVDILDEIAVRFIVNLNSEERENFIRICFQIEEAHWFYIDFYVNQQPERKLQSGTIRTFAEHIFRHVPFLQSHVNNLDNILESWRNYKLSVPTFGAIILNTFMDKVLLVQGFWTRTSWGFPKGKINQEEEPHICAAREVYEETGYDISDRVDPDVFIEHLLNEQSVRLYIVHGVPEDTRFQPRSRCEIRDIRWFDINHLPVNKSDQNCKNKNGFSPNSFYMVIPFMRELKQYVQNKLRERLLFQDENLDKKTKSGRKPSKSDRKTPQSATRGETKTPIRRLNSENYFDSAEMSREADRKSESKSKGKKSRRQLFDGIQTNQNIVQVQDRGPSSREQTVTPKAKSGSTTPQHLGSSSKQPKMKGRKGSMQGETIQEPNKQVHKPSSKPQLLPQNFCPTAWKNFKLDQRALLMAFLDLPTRFDRETSPEKGRRKR